MVAVVCVCWQISENLTSTPNIRCPWMSLALSRVQNMVCDMLHNCKRNMKEVNPHFGKKGWCLTLWKKENYWSHEM